MQPQGKPSSLALNHAVQTEFSVLLREVSVPYTVVAHRGASNDQLYTERDSNPHGFEPRDFKARASAIPPSVHGIGRTFRIANSTKEFSLRGLP